MPVLRRGDPRPVIGLTVELLEPPLYPGRRRFQLFTDYLGCLRAAGAVPLLLPTDAPPAEVGAWFERVDGVLLTGGTIWTFAPWGDRRRPRSANRCPR